ncbi:unnamed protein product, partial [Timema podura]|nr:unnamed protein product [Timema podura]
MNSTRSIEGLQVWGDGSSSNVQCVKKLLDTSVFSCPKCGKVYRWMTSLSRHMRLECGQVGKYSCQICGRSVHEIVEDARLRWYGDVMRMEKERMPKEIMDMKYVGNKPQGRPRKSWEEKISESVK